MEDSTFHTLFGTRKSSIGLSIVPGFVESGSRVGGNAPEYFHDPNRREWLTRYRYLATIGPEFAPFICGRELSIFLGVSFRVFSKDTRSPLIDIECVMHKPSPRSSQAEGRMPDIDQGALKRSMTLPSFITIGGTPQFVQDEPEFERPLAALDLVFAMRIDDDGYPADFVSGDYPLGYGALYLYGEQTGIDSFSRIVAGFTQFS